MKRCPKSDEVGVIGGRDGSPGAIDGAGLLSRKFVIWRHRSLGWRAALGRCGHSKNKPFCDGAHQAAGFMASD
jgi:hypothetical protein